MKSSAITSSVKHVSSAKLKTIRKRLANLYGVEEADTLLDRFFHMIGRYGVGVNRTNLSSKVISQKDAVLITYADMVSDGKAHPFSTLKEFCTARLKGAFSAIHILPFYPWTSDDGFSVVDYREVDKRYGNWDDVSRLSEEFELMFDLVLNHCSSKSPWFREYVSGIEPGSNYILEGDEEADLSSVVRPRASPLLTPYQTRKGERHVWTTFSADQVDLDWTSPDLLFEFLDIIMFYASLGCRILRLDAVAFLWKEIGTNCLHLPKTHEVIKLIRNFIEVVAPEVLILTETNVPHQENISYFGKGDEAHAVYQFSLPPLLLHGLLKGTAKHVTNWAAHLAPPPKGCHFLNFTASHDGIGVRPLEGILDTDEILSLADEVRGNGGHVSMRKLEDGSEFPYELNATYYGALSHKKDPELGKKRFLCSQAVALAMKGIPAVYFHSLCATPNYTEGVKETGHNRTINRKKWKSEELETLLEDEESNSGEIFEWYTRVLRRRASCPAFHPDASQKVIELGDEIFAFERRSLDGSQVIICLFNFLPHEVKSNQKQTLASYLSNGSVKDLISGGEFSFDNESFALRPYQALWLCQN
ncbi:sugar phosphorylase [Candidatus Seribacter sulfatis]|jgi:sucrose phosphorylase|uniref:sugar phosphorylase n=1 Tax=Candidatus Seribacter sulfatis TaxID=3381756 RepID=UPI00389B2F41